MNREGKTSKIHWVVGTQDLPVNFEITGGQLNDSSVANELLSLAEVFQFTVTDKESLRDGLKAKRSVPLIPRLSHSTFEHKELDWKLYRYRHLVESLLHG